MMAEIIVTALLALMCAGVFLTVRLCARMLPVLERIERALAPARMAAEAREPKQDAEQARYEQGVANILAYGTREMVRRRGEAQ